MELEDNIVVRVVSLPMSVEGLISDTPDGTHNIYINANYSYEMQQIFLRHELAHIRNNDFYNPDDIETLELRAKKEMEL